MLVTSSKIISAIESAKKVQADPGTIAEILKPLFNKSDNKFSKIVVRVNSSYDILDLDQINYIQAVDSYSRITLIGNRTFIDTKPLNYFEALLSEKGFWRVHKSFLINLRQLTKVVAETSSYVVMTGNVCIPVSSRRKMEFLDKLKNLICF